MWQAVQMGGRTKPNWAIFVGGPFDGRREILAQAERSGPLIWCTPSATPGMRVPHEYLLTSERRKGGFHEATARVVRFVRTLPEKPSPPPTPPKLPMMAVWGLLQCGET